jgi:hypothetical protein
MKMNPKHDDPGVPLDAWQATKRTLVTAAICVGLLVLLWLFGYRLTETLP